MTPAPSSQLGYSVTPGITTTRRPCRLDETQKRGLLARAKNGDNLARLNLLNDHLTLVIYIAKRHYRPGAFMQLGDLIQQGCVGFLRAIDKFDLKRRSRGRRVRFVTYATFWIEHPIRRAIQNYGRTIAVPVSVQEDARMLQCASAEANAGNSRESDLRNLARTIGITEKRWDALCSVPKEIVPLEDVPHPQEESALEDSERCAEQDQSRQRVRKLLRLLTARERRIIERLYGLNGDRSQTAVQVGRLFGLTPQRVGQLRTIAFKKMNAHFGQE